MSSAGVDPQVAAALKVIWDQRQGEMRRRVSLVEAALGSVAADGYPDEVARAEGERAAHMLAGVLGTFGLDRGSELARELEDALVACSAAAVVEVARLDELTAELGRVVDAGPGDSSPAPRPRARHDAPVLIASADARLLQALSQEVAGRGMRVNSAESLDEAYKSVAEDPPGAVLLELDSAARSEAALELIGDMNARDVPVLAVAAADALMHRVEAARRGARGFLNPGLEPSRLIDALLRELDRRRAPEEAHVVAVDDDPTILATLEVLLSPLGITVTTVQDPLALWDVLEDQAPDLAVLDVDMPTVDGIGLCQAIRNDPRFGDLPVLFLTASTAPDTIQRMFAAGADDYVAKPIIAPELTTRIGNRLERARVTRRLADTDGLTGLATRRKAEDVLARFQRLADRNRQPLSLAILDIDHFKAVNDRLGHAEGDAVLRRLSRLLLECFRGEDVVARWGGEEFVIGMLGAPRANAVQRVTEALEAFRSQAHDEVPITFSAGVAEYPAEGADLESLHRAVDRALYQAKAAGRNRIVAADHESTGAGSTDVVVVNGDHGPRWSLTPQPPA